MIRGECNWDQNEARLLWCQEFSNLRRLSPKPWLWTHLGLPDQSVWVLELEFLHDMVHSSTNFSWVCVTGVNNIHWQRVGREQDSHFVSDFCWELLQLLGNILCKGLDQPWLSGPTINDRPRNLAFRILLLYLSPQLVDRRPCCRIRELWVLREGYSSGHTVFQHLLVSLVSHRSRISERNVGLVRSRFWMSLVQNLAHLGRLILRPSPDRRPTTNLTVLLLNLGRTEPSYVLRKYGLVLLTNRNQVIVGEQLV